MDIKIALVTSVDAENNLLTTWLPHMHYHIAPHRHGTFRSPQSERPYPAVSKSHSFSSCSLLNGTILRAYLISILTKYQQLQAQFEKFTHKQSQTYGVPWFSHAFPFPVPSSSLRNLVPTKNNHVQHPSKKVEKWNPTKIYTTKTI